MYFSFLHTSDLIIQLLEMFHIHFSCISNMKNKRVSSKYRIEPERIKKNDNDILN